MLHHSPLGREIAYPSRYAPEILYPIPRALGRDAVGLTTPLPFSGVDFWTGYEMSWLDGRGKPHVAVATFAVPADSPNLIESKSFKLYLNALNDTRFENADALVDTVQRDLSAAAGAPVSVRLNRPNAFLAVTCELPGVNVDDLAVDIDTYEPCADFLRAGDAEVSECLTSHLLKSNCPVTGQPDWASLMVKYTGPRIAPEDFLRYVVSFRHHTGFHEQCVEQIFHDVFTRVQPSKLTVYARYTRRGGLDINPFRSTWEDAPGNVRTYRQ